MPYQIALHHKFVLTNHLLCSYSKVPSQSQIALTFISSTMDRYVIFEVFISCKECTEWCVFIVEQSYAVGYFVLYAQTKEFCPFIGDILEEKIVLCVSYLLFDHGEFKTT